MDAQLEGTTKIWPGVPPVLPPLVDEIGRWSPPVFDSAIQRLVERSDHGRLLLQLWIEDVICGLVALPHDQQSDQLEDVESHAAARAERLRLFRKAAFILQLEEHFSRTKRQRDRIIYSMLRCRDQARVQELSLAIREGEIDFSTAAIRYSEGPESAQGGRIGPIAPTVGHPELNQRLEIANEGDLIGPFPVGDQHVLLRLDTRITTRLDESTQPQLLEELYHDWLQRQTDALMEGRSIEPIEYLPVP